MNVMKPFFTYFGGKYRAAPRYPSPTRKTIVEPFAGAAGYSLRHWRHDVVLCDLDEVVAGTWEYLIRVSTEEVLSLPLYDGSWNTLDDLTLPQEQKWLIGWWLNKGTSSPCKTPSKWMRESDNLGENYWGPGVRARIARQVEFIRHWKVIHGSYEDLPNWEATWFIDPPYQVAGRSYKQNSIDFPSLGDWCQRREGQAIVCENAGADWLPFEDFRNIKGTAGKGRTGVSKEVIYVKDSLI